MTLLPDNDIMPSITDKIALLNETLLPHSHALKNTKQNSFLLSLKDPFTLIKFRFLLVRYKIL